MGRGSTNPATTLKHVGSIVGLGLVTIASSFGALVMYGQANIIYLRGVPPVGPAKCDITEPSFDSAMRALPTALWAVLWALIALASVIVAIRIIRRWRASSGHLST